MCSKTNFQLPYSQYTVVVEFWYDSYYVKLIKIQCVVYTVTVLLTLNTSWSLQYNYNLQISVSYNKILQFLLNCLQINMIYVFLVVLIIFHMICDVNYFVRTLFTIWSSRMIRNKKYPTLSDVTTVYGKKSTVDLIFKLYI